MILSLNKFNLSVTGLLLYFGTKDCYRQNHLLQRDAPMLKTIFVLSFILTLFGGIDEIVILLGDDGKSHKKGFRAIYARKPF